MPACQALLESKKKDDPDAYDPVEADVSSSEESGDDDDMQGQDIPDQQPMAPSSPPPHPFIPFPDSQPIFEREHDQPIPPEEPTPAMPIHPAAETAPGPSSGAASHSLSSPGEGIFEIRWVIRIKGTFFGPLDQLKVSMNSCQLLGSSSQAK